MTIFIGEYTIPHPDICDDLITYFKNHPEKEAGGVGDAEEKLKVKKEIKDSMDLGTPLGKIKLIDQYANGELQWCLEEYKKQYYYANKTQSRYKIMEEINIQHYAPGQAFHGWHYERSYGKKEHLNRHLVFMTYLNDVTDNGGTEFFYQNVTIQPKKGLTLIWPSDWTFTHRGVPSITEEKYIITGWYSYFEDDKNI